MYDLEVRVESLIPGLGRSLGGGHGNPFQHSYQKNSMDRGAWRATVCRAAENQTQLKGLRASLWLKQ